MNRLSKTASFLCISFLTVNSAAQEMQKDIVVKRDTIAGRVLEQTKYTFKVDSVFVKRQIRDKAIMDSVIDQVMLMEKNKKK